ncbi:MAG: hypothetical protein AAF503_03020 [Pseudomonadota bacterium]
MKVPPDLDARPVLGQSARGIKNRDDGEAAVAAILVVQDHTICQPTISSKTALSTASVMRLPRTLTEPRRVYRKLIDLVYAAIPALCRVM